MNQVDEGVGVLWDDRDSLANVDVGLDGDDGVELEWIGRGRSANVYVGKDKEGRRVAHKVFIPDSLSKLVFYVIDGAPNPYGWNEHAIQTAVARRHILTLLIEYWFSASLTLPETYGSGWNERVRAYQMFCEFINGYHLPLRGPGNDEEADFLPMLKNEIMKPLQHHLEEAGFDGMVWQAGRGNPVAASNFMLRKHDGADPKWVWIDLESGVPALFAINPLEQLKFYLPACLRYRRALFDDTNMVKLRSYMEIHREGIEGVHGKESVEKILTQLDKLEYHQNSWKSLPRHSRSIESYRVRGVLSDSEAWWYQERPYKWYSRLLAKGSVQLTGKVARTVKNGGLRILRFNYWNVIVGSWGFVTSQKYRTHLSRMYVGKRIEGWEKRKILKPSVVSKLQEELTSDESSEYITDFGVHLMIKPFMKVLQWSVIPTLFMMGTINEVMFGVLLVSGGAIGRTVYTLGRMAQAAIRRQRLPWIAFGVGVLPVVGNVAYPIEVVKCGAGDGRTLARFIVYDSFSGIGRVIPIWGGPDTLTEHFFNRLPYNLFTWYKRIFQRPSPSCSSQS